MNKKYTTNLTTLPACQGRGDCRLPARYDFRTFSGPWAYACEVHWSQLRASSNLGTGYGHYLLLPGETPPVHLR
jgi:hypothetical protein